MSLKSGWFTFVFPSVIYCGQHGSRPALTCHRVQLNSMAWYGRPFTKLHFQLLPTSPASHHTVATHNLSQPPRPPLRALRLHVRLPSTHPDHHVLMMQVLCRPFPHPTCLLVAFLTSPGKILFASSAAGLSLIIASLLEYVFFQDKD